MYICESWRGNIFHGLTVTRYMEVMILPAMTRNASRLLFFHCMAASMMVAKGILTIPPMMAGIIHGDILGVFWV